MSPEVCAAELLMSTLYLQAKKLTKKYISPVVLRKMYRQYSKWRKLVKRHRNSWWLCKDEQKRLHGFDSYFIHYLLERCFWIRYGDSDMVSDLLTILFEVDGHLGKIFHFQIVSLNPKTRFTEELASSSSDSNEALPKNFPRRNDYIFESTWRSDIIASELVKPVDYFIEHAYKKKLLFNRNRFAEHCIAQGAHPVTSIPGRRTFGLLLHPPCAICFMFPDVLPKLLQHGLFARATPNDRNVGKLLTGVIGLYWCAHDGICSPGYGKEILRVGNMLLRAVESVDISVLMKSQKIPERITILPRIVNEVTGSKVLPKLYQRCHGPQELQHLCRHQIRRRLYDCWALPGGISHLPVPSRLKDYLNLKID